MKEDREAVDLVERGEGSWGGGKGEKSVVRNYEYERMIFCLKSNTKGNLSDDDWASTDLRVLKNIFWNHFIFNFNISILFCLSGLVLSWSQAVQYLMGVDVETLSQILG